MRKIISLWVFLLLVFSTNAQNQTKIDSLLLVLETAITDKIRVDVNISIADEYDNVDSAKTAYYAHRAIDLAEQIGYAKGIADAWYEIGWATMQIGNVDEAINIYQKILIKSQQTEYLRGKANAYNGLGNAYEYKADYKQALDNYAESLKLRTALGDKKGMASTYSNIGLTNQYMGRHHLALENYLISLEIAEEERDKNGIARASFNIGSVYDSWSDYPEALEHYFKYLEIVKELGDKRGMGLIYNNLGVTYGNLNDTTKSLEYYLLSSKIWEELDNRRGICSSQVNIGNLLIDQKKYEEALVCFKKGLSLSRELADKSVVSAISNGLGQAYWKLENYELARKFLRQGIGLAQEINYATYIGHGALMLSEVEKAIGNYPAALESYKLYHTYYDSLLGEERSKQISQLEMKYESEKKEQEIQNLAQQATIQSLKLTQSSNRLTMLGIVIVVLLLIGLVFYLINRQKQLALKQRAQNIEQNLLRVQMNPHFTFNAMASIQDYMVSGDAEQAGVYLGKFSKLIRQVLDNSRSEFINLDQEISMLDSYMSLQNLRRDRPFSYQIDLEKGLDSEEIAIPPMFAQPFVENAIEHGIANMKEEAMIKINFSINNDYLILKVSDNGVGIEESTKVKPRDYVSHAVKITKERIDLYRQMKKKKIDFSIESLSPGTQVRFNLPYQYN